MGRYTGARDAGSTTGIATAILALLSAGTVASITLVGVHQLVPTISERLHPGGQSAVRAPDKVVVNPRTAATAAPGTLQDHPSKPRTAGPSDVAVGSLTRPTAITASSVTQAVTHAVAAVVHLPVPAVAPPAVVPTLPAPATPSPSTLPPTVSRGHVYTSRTHESRRGHVSSRQHDTSRAYSGRTARSHRGSSGCATHDARKHRAYPSNVYGDARGRSARGHHGSQGHHGNGDDRGQRGAHGHHGYGDDRGAHDHGHGHSGLGDSQRNRLGH
jgi:hypothetical protein